MGGLLLLLMMMMCVCGGRSDVEQRDRSTHNSSHMEGVFFHPFVPVALVEFVTICWMPEKSRSVTHLRSDGIVEVTEPTRTKFIPICSLEFVENCRLFRTGTSH